MTDDLVIAIDGPSGSGKSSTARGVAHRLGLAYLDTGSMYRAVTVAALRRGVADSDRAGLTRLAHQVELQVGTDPARPTIGVDGVDVTEAIRAPEVSAHVSAAAGVQEIRDRLTAQMRRIIEDTGRRVVVEGRDATTVIWPGAQLRLLLVADPAARIERREAELDGAADRGQVTDQIVRRDRDDSRVSEFLTAADGVVTIDSTDLGLQQVVDLVIGLAAGDQVD